MDITTAMAKASINCSKSNPVLILGNGTVASRIAKQLVAACIPVLVAPTTSTIPSPSDDNNSNNNTVPFEWTNQETWPIAFDQTNTYPAPRSQTTPGGIRSVYLSSPFDVVDPSGLVMSFVDFARHRGARRFVLQSASAIEAGEPGMGKVHAYLRELGTRGEIEWAVLRPTWFQQNIAELDCHVKSIRDESKLFSATGNGKIAWVSADDIAAVAVQALTRDDPPNTEFVVTGPELLSYEDVAQMLSRILGRRIVHIDMSTADLAQRHRKNGMSDHLARMLSSLDTPIKFGQENRANDVVLSVTGAAPRKFIEFMESVKDLWIPVGIRAQLESGR